jgi:hypothetical protein
MGRSFFSYALQNDAPAGRLTQAHIDQHYNSHWLVARARSVKRHAEVPYYEGIGTKRPSRASHQRGAQRAP